MIRILLIARYHQPIWRWKLDYLAAQPDLTIRHIDAIPTGGESLLSTNPKLVQRVYVPMVGNINDPHRSFYRTFTFNIRKFRPHIIHAEEEPESLAGLQIAFIKRVLAPTTPLILHSWQNIQRPKPWYAHWVTQQTLRSADLILCANQEVCNVLRQDGFDKTVQVLPAIGVETNIFFPAQSKIRIESPQQDFKIGYVGRIVREKGLDTLVQAFASLQIASPVSLYLIGDGDYLYELQEQVKRFGISEKVHFLSMMPPAKVAQTMREFDVFVLPSRTTTMWKEQLGRVLIEAMASKIAVVGSNSGAIPEVIGDSGLIFPEGDASALTECLHKLISNPQLHAHLAEQGYQRVLQYYTQEHIAKQTAQLYRQFYYRS